MGRWIRYGRGDRTYHTDIPNAECDREPVETEDEVSDDSTAVADTTHDDAPEYFEDRARIPGPLDGDYLLRVGHAPRAEWRLYLDADGGRAPAPTFGDMVAPASLSDTVSSYR